MLWLHHNPGTGNSKCSNITGIEQKFCCVGCNHVRSCGAWDKISVWHPFIPIDLAQNLGSTKNLLSHVFPFKFVFLLPWLQPPYSKQALIFPRLK